MITRLVRHGDGYAVVLDAPLLNALNIDPETPLELSVAQDQTLLIRPGTMESKSRAETIETPLQRTNARYGGTLEKLSK